jgi:hypothetical protein
MTFSYPCRQQEIIHGSNCRPRFSLEFLAKGISAITLFVEDLAAAKQF